MIVKTITGDPLDIGSVLKVEATVKGKAVSGYVTPERFYEMFNQRKLCFEIEGVGEAQYAFDDVDGYLVTAFSNTIKH